MKRAWSLGGHSLEDKLPKCHNYVGEKEITVFLSCHIVIQQFFIPCIKWKNLLLVKTYKAIWSGIRTIVAKRRTKLNNKLPKRGNRSSEA